MSHIEDNIVRSGFRLPPPAVPAGFYLPALRQGDMIYTSGQLPLKDGKLVEPGGKGKVNEINQHDATTAAGSALLNALSAIKALTGSLDAIDRIVKLTVYVASESYFSGQHLVANGVSSLLVEFFGEKGRHVRSAVGVAELPLDASVEIELIAACNPSCKPG